MRSRVLGALVITGALSVVLPSAAGAAPRGNACNPYAAKSCLLPFPNDLLTVRDKHSATGRRVHFPKSVMPVNVDGKRIAAGDYNRADGFSPGGLIIARVPGLDTPAALRKSHVVGLRDPSKYKAKRQSLLLIDEQTGKRRLVWGELDSQAGKRASTNLLIHPGYNLAEGHRFVVALRNLRNGKGKALKGPGWFARVRAGKRDRARYTRIFRVLRKAKVKRASVDLAWDFTVASRRSLTGRMLQIRNNAFAQLGDHNLADGKVQGRAPAYHVDKVEDFTVAEDPDIARRVTGTFTVPCYLDKPGCPPGSRFHYSSKKADALPTQMKGNTIAAPFICNIPRAALVQPGRPSLYGHGLLGGPDEVEAGNVEDMGQEHDMVFCATAWAGMSAEDVGTIIDTKNGTLHNLAGFPTLADRLQQGVLDFLFLARLMHHPQGFVADAAFRPQGKATIDPSHVYYDGNSQGGIFGGITTAVSPDVTRAVLGVSGMDYGGMLLSRSKDWPVYEKILGYPDLSIRPLLLALIQQLWDRGEPEGYAAHMTDHPLPDTPKHTVLMQIAVGDQQVSDFAAETEARTIGARLYRPAVADGRWPAKVVGYGIPSIPHFPWKGSALVYWDSGPGHNPPPPLTNVVPEGGKDPHGDPRSTKAARQQKSDFLKPNGRVTNVCGGKPCRTDAFTP